MRSRSGERQDTLLSGANRAGMARPGWDDYFLDLMDQVARRATCDRGRSGCVVVRDHRIVSTGYVGSPPGLPHCDDAGHDLKTVIDEDGNARQHCTRTIHAEQNAICQAARHGVPLEGATLYCRMVPCMVCAMLIVSVGIRRVVAARMYHAGSSSLALFEAAGVEVEVRSDDVEAYERQA